MAEKKNITEPKIDILIDVINVLSPLDRAQQVRVLATVIVFFGMESEIRSTLEN